MSEHSLLLVEDNEDDVFIMRRALMKAGIDLPIHVIGDGKEALDYLLGANDYADRDKYPLPSLIFMDLKLPYVNGLEILEQIREQPLLRGLEVVVLTSSEEDRDQKRAGELGVRSYLVKPPTAEMLLQAIGSPVRQPCESLGSLLA